MSAIKNLAVILFFLQSLFPFSGKAVAAGEQGAASALFGSQQSGGYKPLSGPNYPLEQDSYFTDDSGNILMIVNVLGQVNRQGQLVVRENVDFATILALAGGLAPEANLRKVLVARKEPDKNGVQAYIVDVKEFYKHGDRSSFIALKPNDTIIFPERSFSFDKFARLVNVVYPWTYIYTNLKK